MARGDFLRRLETVFVLQVISLDVGLGYGLGPLDHFAQEGLRDHLFLKFCHQRDHVWVGVEAAAHRLLEKELLIDQTIENPLAISEGQVLLLGR